MNTYLPIETSSHGVDIYLFGPTGQGSVFIRYSGGICRRISEIPSTASVGVSMNREFSALGFDTFADALQWMDENGISYEGLELDDTM